MWIGLAAALLFIPFLGDCNLFDWDEVNFAECAREMLVTGNYAQVQIAYKPFWEKPPLFIWMQAASMKVFGVDAFAARFPNALCGILSLVLWYGIGKREQSKKTGVFWALMLASAILPHVYFKSGIIDPWFNLFILLSLYFVYLFLSGQNKKPYLQALMAGLLLGLAVLTKGPAALLISGLTVLVYLFWTKGLRHLFSVSVLVYVSTALLVSSSWFAAMWLSGHEEIVLEFIQYQLRLFETPDSGHGGPWYYHPLVLLIGMFPVSFLFLLLYRKSAEGRHGKDLWRKMLLSLFWVVLILFSVVETKIIHYSSLCYVPMAYVAASGISEHLGTLRFPKWTRVFYGLLAILLSATFILISFTEELKGAILSSHIIQDPFAEDCLRANVPWTGFEVCSGLLFGAGSLYLCVGLIRKRQSWFTAGLILCLLCIQLFIVLMVPRIEAYTQRASIDFYRDRAGEECYLETRGFKSYAYLFYSRREPSYYKNPAQQDFVALQLKELEKQGFNPLTNYSLANLIWLEQGEIDRPAYMVVKSTEEEKVETNKKIVKLYSKNGYSFYLRRPEEAAK